MSVHVWYSLKNSHSERVWIQKTLIPTNPICIIGLLQSPMSFLRPILTNNLWSCKLAMGNTHFGLLIGGWGVCHVWSNLSEKNNRFTNHDEEGHWTSSQIKAGPTIHLCWGWFTLGFTTFFHSFSWVRKQQTINMDKIVDLGLGISNITLSTPMYFELVSTK